MTIQSRTKVISNQLLPCTKWGFISDHCFFHCFYRRHS